MSNPRSWLRIRKVWLLIAVAILVALLPGTSRAAQDGLNIQVSPSPLTLTLKPGEQRTATVTVRNLSSHSETLIPKLNGFTIDKTSSKIELQSDVPLGLDKWVSFKQRTLTIAPGATQPLDIIYDTPKDVGFSYSLAITLNPAEKETNNQGANFEASVAVFNLINIDRPGAKRELKILDFKSTKNQYEYLPAEFTLTVQNDGNIIDQPTGNVFIQRSFDDKEPIATLPINKANSYILPSTSRALTTNWNDGFPKFVAANTGGSTTQNMRLSWDWSKLDQLRFGKYVAKVVLIYNDGQRDVPLVTSHTFWVIPWKLILISLFVIAVLVTGLIVWGKMILKGTKKMRRYARHK